VTSALLINDIKPDKRMKNKQQDNQALLKAKYCPQVAAASCTHKNGKTTTLTYDLEIQ